MLTTTPTHKKIAAAKLHQSRQPGMPITSGIWDYRVYELPEQPRPLIPAAKLHARARAAQRPLALLIAAHNEEMVLAATILSAMAAGQASADIYVVNDSSTDATEAIATKILGASHVLNVERSGKAKALKQAIAAFDIIGRYRWLHIADADGVFAGDYFTVIKANLSPKYAAATGHIQSLPGGWISKYRLYEYTVGVEIMRRIQAFFDTIPVIPGPTSMYRTDIIGKLDFEGGTLTEDMDITFQIHRNKLGKIGFFPKAHTFTQDPKDFTDYYKQITRWYRGNFQVMRRHRTGLGRQRLDAYIGYVMFEQWVMIAELALFPLLAWWSQNYAPLALMFLNDLVIFLSFTIWASALNKRYDVLEAFPLFYFLRMVNIFVFVKAWIDIVVRRKFQTAAVAGWDTAGRRYKISADAVIN